MDRKTLLENALPKIEFYSDPETARFMEIQKDCEPYNDLMKSYGFVRLVADRPDDPQIGWFMDTKSFQLSIVRVDDNDHDRYWRADLNPKKLGCCLLDVRDYDPTDLVSTVMMQIHEKVNEIAEIVEDLANDAINVMTKIVNDDPPNPKK